MGVSRDVTIQDGARKAGVTIATVSRVPNRSSNVASDPHTRVLENLFGGWIRGRDIVGEVQNGAQTTPVVEHRGSEEAVLHEIHEVTGRRQFAKQVLTSSKNDDESHDSL